MRVVEVDEVRKRIALSMKTPRGDEAGARQSTGVQARSAGGRPAHSRKAEHGASGNDRGGVHTQASVGSTALADAFRKAGKGS